MLERVLPQAAVAVDLAIFTVREQQLQVMLVRRRNPPFLGAWAMPGGFVEAGESLDVAATRELAEETGLDAAVGLHLEQLASYGEPARDPRGRVVSVCYLALMPDLPLPVAGGDASAAKWVPVREVAGRPGALAFDHHAILADGVERVCSKLEYTNVAAAFCRPEFTITELRRVYEIVWGQPVEPRNFHRKVTHAAGFLESTGRTTTRDGGRPALLYRRGPAVLLHPAILRSLPEPHLSPKGSRRRDAAKSTR